MKHETKKLAGNNYGAMLEAYYDDLVLKEKEGKISRFSHQALDTFVRELRELVAEANPNKLAKAA